jgi:purine-binding chemotaxis protein CheW
MATATSPGQTLARAGSQKYLIFTLGAEEFGIPVLHIKEIMQMQPITPVPQLPPYVKGVINLRGQVIPVVDLALRLQMTPREVTPRTCIVVVRYFAAEGERLIGAIADGMSEVLTIGAEEMEESPDFGAGNAVSYVRGMAKIRGKVKLLLDTGQVFSSAAIPAPGPREA